MSKRNEFRKNQKNDRAFDALPNAAIRVLRKEKDRQRRNLRNLRIIIYIVAAIFIWILLK